MYVPYVNNQNGAKDTFTKQFYNSFENTYQHINLTDWETGRLAFLPLVVEGPSGKKICITEADLLNYPGLYLSNQNNANSLTGVIAPYPKEIKQGGTTTCRAKCSRANRLLPNARGKQRFRGG